MDRCLRVNSPRQLYKPYFGSTQRPSSPGLLATNGVEAHWVALTTEAWDRVAPGERYGCEND